MHRKAGEDAVSPLIATILLIAIAVALGTIVLTISENLADETIPDAPPTAAFSVQDHSDFMNATPQPLPDGETYTADDCSDTLLLFKVDEDIRLRDYRLRIGQDDAFFDVWYKNETKYGNVNETFKLFVDNFPAGDGGDDYEITVDQEEHDLIPAGTSFLLRETFHDPMEINPATAESRNRACAYFQFGDEVQVQLIHASGDMMIDATVKLV